MNKTIGEIFMNDKERIDKAVRAVCDECKVGYDDPFITGAGEYLKHLVAKGITIEEIPAYRNNQWIIEQRDTYYDLYIKAIELLRNENRTEDELGQFWAACQGGEYCLHNESMTDKATRWLLEELAKEK